MARAEARGREQPWNLVEAKVKTLGMSVTIIKNSQKTKSKMDSRLQSESDSQGIYWGHRMTLVLGFKISQT